MKRLLLAGAAAFALMTGVALAQGAPTESSTTTRSTTTSTVPAVGSYKSSETHQGVDHEGNAIHKKKTYHSGASGSTVTSRTRTALPDGSRTTYREKQTDPYSGSTTEKKTTTTTIDR
jgi:hypothetical protein